MKSLRTPLLVPLAFFIFFIIEGAYHLYAAISLHNSLRIITNSTGIAIGVVGVILMAYRLKRSVSESKIKSVNKSIY